MAAGQSSQTLKASPKPIALIALGLAMVLFMGWLAYANFFAPPKAAPMNAEAKTNQSWLKQVAVRTGGDMSKLTPEERAKLHTLAGGYGALALQTALKEK